jgi:hypothetical protein
MTARLCASGFWQIMRLSSVGESSMIAPFDYVVRVVQLFGRGDAASPAESRRDHFNRFSGDGATVDVAAADDSIACVNAESSLLGTRPPSNCCDRSTSPVAA